MIGKMPLENLIINVYNSSAKTDKSFIKMETIKVNAMIVITIWKDQVTITNVSILRAHHIKLLHKMPNVKIAKIIKYQSSTLQVHLI